MSHDGLLVFEWYLLPDRDQLCQHMRAPVEWLLGQRLYQQLYHQLHLDLSIFCVTKTIRILIAIRSCLICVIDFCVELTLATNYKWAVVCIALFSCMHSSISSLSMVYMILNLSISCLHYLILKLIQRNREKQVFIKTMEWIWRICSK